MQGTNLTLNGSGLGTVVAPCAAEAFELISAAHSFTFQYALHPVEVPVMASGPGPQAGQAIGSPENSENVSATDFRAVAESPKDCPWPAGSTVGYIVGTAADVIAVRPRRAGGN